MNISDISTQLMYTTVPLYVKKNDGSQCSGTGFIYSIIETDNTSIPFLITNYHVLEGAEMGFMELHLAENDKPTDKSINIQFDRTIVNNKLGELDLVALPMAATFNELFSKNIYPFYRTVSADMIPREEEMNELAAIEDITFIGYPNGLYDEINKMSIVRQGITATPIWNNFKGKEAFLIDGGVFPGSSGSPVFIYNRGTYPTKDGFAVGNRLLFVGVMTQSILRKSNSGDDSYLNLGVVINSRALNREILKLVDRIKLQ
ncbi:MAG TPA: serine protease [Lachnospiraceae bacterium]|nr:serine protease [Lachnospiraceae bacterium]